MRYRLPLIAMTASLALLPVAAKADVVISSDATQNMTCEAGVCAPTASTAVLNVTDLENLLAAGNTEVTTTGSGVEAKNIVVSAALSWTSASLLALDAHRAITIGATIASNGAGGINLDANGAYGIKYEGGNITFAQMTSSFSINGHSYQLVGSIASLASAVATFPNGRLALANYYDASGDGTYTTNPIPTIFKGIFDGIGNTIANLTINDPGGTDEGLFYEIARNGIMRNLALADANIIASNQYGSSGSIAGQLFGSLFGCSSSGNVTAGDYAGGLVEVSSGTITNSFSNATVHSGFVGGGLAGTNNGTIRASYATGAVTAAQAGGLVGSVLYGGLIEDSHATGSVIVSGEKGYGGGLAGFNQGWLLMTNATGTVSSNALAYEGGLVGLDGTGSKIVRSFATGDVTGPGNSTVGGFVGIELGTTDNSYATGAVSVGAFSQVGGFVGCMGSCVTEVGGAVHRSYSSGSVPRTRDGNAGGFAGVDDTSGEIGDSYWDTTTSGHRKGTGNRGNEPGLKGLTTTKMQSRLPPGFSSKIWAENANINNGLPYLIDNPPPN